MYRTTSAWQERCRRLSAALRNEEALVSCDAARALAPSERSMLRARADLLFRMRRYPDAVEAFAALGDDADAVFWRARSLARAGRIDDSLASFARIAEGPDRELSARARFLAGTLLEDTDLAAAEASYRAVADQAPGAEASTWYGLLAPARTPQPVITRLHGETVKILAGPTRQRWKRRASSPTAARRRLLPPTSIRNQQVGESHQGSGHPRRVSDSEVAVFRNHQRVKESR